MQNLNKRETSKFSLLKDVGSSERFKATDVSFKPKRYHSQLDELCTIENYFQKLKGVETKNNLDVLNSINAISDLQSNVLNNFTEDYNNAFKTYVCLVKNGLLKEEFPFNDWVFESKKIEDYLADQKVNINCHLTLEGIVEISKNDIEFAKHIFLVFLVNDTDRNSKNSYYFTYLDFTIRKLFSDIRVIDILKCKEANDFSKILSGKEIQFTFYNRVLDAASILSTPSCGDLHNFAEVFSMAMTLETEYGIIEGFRKKCIQFSKGDIWKYINQDEAMLSKFARKLVNSPTALNYFFSVSKNTYKNSSKISFNEIKDGMLSIFFDEIIKSNDKLGNYILDMLESSMPEKIKEKFQNEKSSVIKIMNYHALNLRLCSELNEGKLIKV